jgi:hypothetical protein
MGSAASPEYDQALTELGKALEESGWKPDIPIGTSLDSDPGPNHRWKVCSVFCACMSLPNRERQRGAVATIPKGSLASMRLDKWVSHGKRMMDKAF